MNAVTQSSSDRRLPPASRRPESRARWLYRRGWILAAVASLLFGLCLITGPGGAERTISNVTLIVAALLAAITCGWRSRQVGGWPRWSWRLLAAAVLCWGLGRLVSAWYESLPSDLAPVPSLADVGYLGLPVLAAAGLLTIPTAAQSFAHRARSVLDGLLIAVSLLLISWLAVLRPLIAAGAHDRLAMITSAAYPVSDLVLITMALYLFGAGRQLRTAPMPLVLIGSGLITFALADSGFAYLTVAGRDSSGALLQLGWFVGLMLILLAALNPAGAVEASDQAAPANRPLDLLLPYLAVLAAVITSSLELLRSGNLGAFVPWNRNALILLIVGRQLLTLLENRALTRGLEARVEARTAELRASEQRFQALVQHSSDVVTVVDEQATVIYQSESMAGVFGHPANTLIGRPLTALLEPQAAGRLRDALVSVARRPYGTLSIELPIRRADDRICQAELTITNLLQDPNVQALVLNTRDITDRKELESQLVHEAFHDALTNLANRALFTDRVEQALRRRDRDEHPIAVLFLDLDGFKEVNDSRGHAAGDELLTQVADRLRASVRPDDTVARFGGDEFAVLVEDGQHNAELVSARVLEQISAPFVVDGNDLHVSAGIGIAFGGEHAENAGQLMRNADLAMYRAKSAGHGRYALYNPEMHIALVDRLQLAADLRRGLDEGEFSLHYQPTIDLTSGAITGFEALARWQHHSRGQIPPVEFIPLAESTGLIRPLGTYVLREACRQVMEWTSDGRRPLTISVNVSARQLDQPEFLDLVAAALADSGLPAHRLCLEMTESVLMEDTEHVLVMLNGLKGLGVQLAIDDFGTGYSSLGYLHRFPFDVLKIDKSFVDRLQDSAGELTLARTIVQLGQGLGVTTVAEGLERFEQFVALRQIGCEVGQGFYFSRPVPAEQANRLLAAEAETTWHGTAASSARDAASNGASALGALRTGTSAAYYEGPDDQLADPADHYHDEHQVSAG
ncbi:MAG: EAL domain-containing protein [Jatrophihabitantaceae bacterium]